MRRRSAYAAGPRWATARRVLRPLAPRRRDEAAIRCSRRDPPLEQLDRGRRQPPQLERHRLAFAQREVAAQLVEYEAVLRVAGIDAELAGGVRGEVRGRDADEVRIGLAGRERH